ncbi:MAG TPA: alpha/beta hydrolase [Thermoanaerobaculia bacterium]|nr:alpha/beta hydrolase [Thermoanaerobaculia bacterium]
MSEARERRVALSTGIALHVVEAGPEDGPVCLLLHGFPESSFGWRTLIGPLAAAGLRVVAPDQRGYARSDKPRGIGAYRLDRMVDDAAALLDAVGARSARVLAHDWGGAVAWYLAAARPQRVERLAILNMPHPAAMRRRLARDREQLRRSWYVFFFQLPFLPERYLRRHGGRKLRGVFRASSRPGTFSDAELDRYVEDAARPRALTSMLHWYRAAFRRRAPRPPSWRVRVPTRIVWGVQDTAIVPELAAESAALCDDAEVVRLPDAGHWLHHEEPERVASLVLEHLLA